MFQELCQATEDPGEGRMGVVSALKELIGWRGRHYTIVTKKRSQMLSLGKTSQRQGQVGDERINRDFLGKQRGEWGQIFR